MTRAAKQTTAVMAGFIPAIHVLFFGDKQDVDARDFRREDGASRLLPGHDGPGVIRSFSSILLALPAALISFLISSAPAYADLKLCNRMSYVVEVAIGIDDKAATATRGWFRIDPAPRPALAQGPLTPAPIPPNPPPPAAYASPPIPQ